MKQKIISGNTMILLVSLLSLLFLTSCVGLTRNTGEIPFEPVHIGKKGLTLEFIPNAPPPTVFAPEKSEQFTFDVGVRIKNEGAYDVTNGYLILNVERDYMKIKDWNIGKDKPFTKVGAESDKLSFKMKGKSQLNMLGEDHILLASVQPLQIDKLTEQHTSSIMLTACYDYNTDASSEICIDTDIYNLKPQDKVCTPKTVSLSGGQGGPITITKIETKMLPQGENYVKPQFVMTLANEGYGSPVKKNKLSQACSSLLLEASDMNVVELKDIKFSKYSLSGGDFECYPKSIKMTNKRGEVICTMKPSILSTNIPTYLTALNVVLDYGYIQTINKQIELKKQLKY